MTLPTDEASENWSTLPNDTSAQSRFEKALALHEQRQFAQAETAFKQLTAAFPGNANLWNIRGINLRMLRRFEEAIWCYREALAITSNGSGIWANLGNALTDLKHAESAIVCHQRAVELRPHDPRLYHTLGIALTAANRHVEALAAFNRALELNPSDAATRWDYSLSRLYQGDYAGGWPEYESRLLTGAMPKRKEPGRRWMGKSYRGERLLILSEQGFGDAIWIARYLRQVKALGGELVFECRPELIPLIASMKVADELVPKADPPPDADWHIHQCSLPGLYTTSVSGISSNPYLMAETDRMAKFKEVMDRGRGKLRVGIVWSGSTTFEANRDRAVPFKTFLQWFMLPGIQLYSLQKGPPEAELEGLPPEAPFINLAPLLGDFADTAAAVAQLDLIIMTDSAVVHLAGALGKPVWVLLNFVSHWLWLLDRTDSPWYSSVRLFRQRSWGDWNGVFDRAAAELMKLAHARRR